MAAPPPKPRRAPRKPQPKPVREVRERLEPKGPKRWGGVARRGAGTLAEDEATASAAWRNAMDKARKHEGPPPVRDQAEWRQDKPKTRQRQRSQPRTTELKLRDDVTAELGKAAQVGRAARLNDRLKQAAAAFERERFEDAARLLKSLVAIGPSVAGVRELYGLTLYRQGRYRDAVKELKFYADLTRDVDQHPVLMDCYRALKRWKPIDDLWEELRLASPSAELVAEGRIVVAGSKADRGDIAGAIALLEQAKADPKRPRNHHLRTWYALADLYERGGDVPRARRLFGRIANHDPDFFDAGARARHVG